MSMIRSELLLPSPIFHFVSLYTLLSLLLPDTMEKLLKREREREREKENLKGRNITLRGTRNKKKNVVGILSETL